ncbi:lytic transglycosylase domain-containing protein [candidate division KSB1 bacterium]|nr:lytic transglycosylase domain-containing protein [candidate division KSB1 bacterium]
MAILLPRINGFWGTRTAQSRKVIYGLVMMLLLVCNARANEFFPVPAQIESNVDFWTKVYSQYSSNHAIIHDKNDLSIIYNVINLNDYYPDSLDISTRWTIVEEIKLAYRRILQRLAQLEAPVNLDSLSREERHVYILWSHADDPLKFDRAVYAVRAQLGLRDRFEASIRRSGYYKENITRIFESYDLPLELTYLPHVESLFDYKSYSKVGAAGVWQFMRQTGKLFMNINYAVDERLDPITATDAAARLLKRNFAELQSWPLAITAYNHGLTSMQLAKAQLGTDDFGVIYDKYKNSMFGFASKNFYAEFLAAWHVAENYKAYFGTIELFPSIRYQSIKLASALYLNQIADNFRVSVDTLIVYNPAFQQSVIHNQVRVPQGYVLRLPYREGFDPREAFVQDIKPAAQSIEKSAKSTWTLFYAQNVSMPDTLKSTQDMSDSELEAYIMKRLKSQPTPSLLESKNAENRRQSPVTIQTD